jgi:hypothetical protein
VSSAGCNPVAPGCGGSTPPARTVFRYGDDARLDERLACNEDDVGSSPTVSTSEPADPPVSRNPEPRRRRRVVDPVRRRLECASVVSTASTRPLYGRGAGSTPAGGSSFRTAVAQRRERWSAMPEAAGSTPAGRASRGRSAVGRAPGSASRRGPFDSGRPLVSEARGVRGAWRAPTSPVRVRILAGLPPTDGLSRAEAARLPGASGAERSARAVRNRYPTALHDRDSSRLLRAGDVAVIDS